MFRLIQVTDTHVIADADAKDNGIAIYPQLQKVVADIKAQQFNPDMLLLTGDLSNDFSEASYRLVKQAFADINCPVYTINGNHDDKAMLESVMVGDNFSENKAFSREGWHFILLDSCIPGKIEGNLSETQLQFAEAEIRKHLDKQIVMVLHHDPMDTPGHMARYPLLNREQLWALIQPYPQVRMMLYGHVHQERTAMANGVVTLSCPSTYFQIMPYAPKFSRDTSWLGYRVIDFMGTDFRTSVIRVPLP